MEREKERKRERKRERKSERLIMNKLRLIDNEQTDINRSIMGILT